MSILRRLQGGDGYGVVWKFELMAKINKVMNPYYGAINPNKNLL